MVRGRNGIKLTEAGILLAEPRQIRDLACGASARVHK